MPAFQGSRIFVGPGTLYAAPIGTTEPTSVTGAWPSGWTEIGYTNKGNDFAYTPTFQEIEVEEQLWPIREVPSMYKATVAFALAELTAQNLILALNGSIGSGENAAMTGTNADGSIWVEPPAPGYETRIMLGWDALPVGTTAPTNVIEAFQRVIYRQTINTEGVKVSHQKGNVYSMFTVTFTLEFPNTGLQPFRVIVPPWLAS